MLAADSAFDLDAVLTPQELKRRLEGRDPATCERLVHDQQLALERLEREIVSLAASIDVASHRLLTFVRRFDESEGWRRAGMLSCAHWLAWRLAIDLGTAREKVRVARALGGLPALDGALRSSQISYSQARALSRVASPANEQQLLACAAGQSGADLERLGRQLRRTGAAPASPLEEQRWVRQRVTDAGLVRIQVQLPPEEAAVVWKALEAAQRLAASRGSSEDVAPQDAPAGVSAEAPPRFGKADALLAVAGSFLAQREHPARTPGRYEVLVLVDRETLRAGSSRGGEPAAASPAEPLPRRCELEDGTPLAPETARRIACDAACVEVVTDAQGTPLDMGRRSRTVPAPLQRALRLRDRGCRWPGCSNAIFVDSHHIEHWRDLGETKLENLLLLCGPHHKLAHEGGFRVRLEAGQPVFLTPAGDRVDAVPARPRVSIGTPCVAPTLCAKATADAALAKPSERSATDLGARGS